MQITLKFAFLLLLFHITLCNYVRAKKFVIYDPDTGTEVTPLQFLTEGLPAMCKYNKTICSCELGMKYGNSFDHKIGIYLTFVVNSLLIQFNIKYNNNKIVAFDISPTSAPPICAPITLPIPVLPCLKVYDVKITSGTMSICMKLKLKILMIHTFEYPLGCLTFNNANGVVFSETIKEEIPPPTTNPDVDEDWTPAKIGVRF